MIQNLGDQNMNSELKGLEDWRMDLREITEKYQINNREIIQREMKDKQIFLVTNSLVYIINIID